MRINGEEVALLCSTASLTDYPTLWWYLLFKPSELVKLFYSAGYEGVEVHLDNLSRFSRSLKRGTLGEVERKIIKAWHGSWRGSLKEAWYHPRRWLALASYILFPEKDQSVKQLMTIEASLPGHRPVVFFHDRPLYPTQSISPFREEVFQPAGEVLQDMDVWSTGELIQEMRRRQFSALAGDTHHLRRGMSLPLDELAPFVTEWHIGVRPDMPLPEVDSLAELKFLLHKEGDPTLVNMLKLLKDNGWPKNIVIPQSQRGTPRIVTEVPSRTFSALRAQKGRSLRPYYLTPSEWVEDNRLLTTRLEQIFT